MTASSPSLARALAAGQPGPSPMMAPADAATLIDKATRIAALEETR